MKLSSVVLISVNLVAASQLSAHAANDTASFIADAISTGPAPRAAAKTPKKQASQARHSAARSNGYVSMTPMVDGVKVRSFKPGRYLPTEAELSAQREAAANPYKSLAATLDPTGTMTGSVSYSGERAPTPSYPSAYQMPSYPVPRADYLPKVVSAVQKVKQIAKNLSASPRAIPGMAAVMPGQIANHPAVKQIVPEPSMYNSLPVQVPQPSSSAPIAVQLPQQRSAANVAAMAPYSVPAPALTQYEQSRLQRIVDSNMPENVYPQSFNGEMRAIQGNPGLAGGGPSPFPLSVNPMMQGGMGRAMSPGAMPVGQQARFGSWHGGSSNLASAAFHSYVPVHMSGPMSIKVNHYQGSRKTGRQAGGVSHVHHSAPVKTTKHAAAVKKTAPEPKVYGYAPYPRYM